MWHTCSKQELGSQSQPLLVNGSETTFVSRQRLGKHVPAAADKLCNNRGTVGNGVFYSVRARGLYGRQLATESTHVEAVSNTCTVTLRVVGGDEKGSLKSETVKYGLKSQGTRTLERLRWQGPAAHTIDRPDLSSERAPHKNKTVTVTQVIKI
jgi:hypothetical protein